MSKTRTAQLEKCPICGQDLVSSPGYNSWCANCNWNIDPSRFESIRKNAFDPIFSWLNSKFRDRVLRHALANNQRNFLHIDTIAAYLLASLVYLLIVALGWAVINSFAASAKSGGIVLGLFGALLLVALLPRKTKIDGLLLKRLEYPGLYDFLDDMCARLKIKTIDKVYCTKEFNAYIYQPLLSRKNVLVLGIPLLSALDKWELLALLGHELGHIRNKDVTNRRFLGMAFSSLCEWHQMIRYNDDFIVFKVIMFPIRLVLFLCISLIGICLWREQQLAEYFADRESVRLAGVHAALGLLKNSKHGITYELTLEKAAMYSGNIPIFDRFREKMRNLPETEVLRINRIMELECEKMSSSHPPQRFRMEFIQNQKQYDASIAIDNHLFDKFHNECQRLEKSMEASILREYREFVAEYG